MGSRQVDFVGLTKISSSKTVNNPIPSEKVVKPSLGAIASMQTFLLSSSGSASSATICPGRVVGTDRESTILQPRSDPPVMKLSGLPQPYFGGFSAKLLRMADAGTRRIAKATAKKPMLAAIQSFLPIG